MRYLKFVLAGLLFFTVMCLCACNGGKKAEEEKPAGAPAAMLVGTWVGTGDEIATVTFGSDGKYKDVANFDGTTISVTGTYTVDEQNGTVLVDDKEDGLQFNYNYTVTDSDLTLQLNGGKERTFKKK
ncbi:MAG: hypothetical protein K6G68_05305 [Oscillospiraceae bacterium]|nr:hypothetical protein [Oscillospiraceae bacterium]